MKEWKEVFCPLTRQNAKKKNVGEILKIIKGIIRKAVGK